MEQDFERIKMIEAVNEKLNQLSLRYVRKVLLYAISLHNIEKSQEA